ncbi:MAG: YceI family protein [Pseudomonadota bacterium]
MLKRLSLVAALAVATASAAIVPAQAEPRTYKIDPSHATIAFLVDHIGYAKTLGKFLKTEGSFVYDEKAKELGEVTVTVDATSVFSNDEARDNHVRNKDFLDSKAHPAITFTATGGQATGETTGTVTGDLTIRGVTKPVTLDVTLNKAGPYPFGHKKHTLGISARATIKRSEWGMTYALGGLVGDDVDLIIEVEAIQQDS